MTSTLHLRPARPGDEPFILDLARRFADFDLPPGRTRAEIEAGTQRWLREALHSPSESVYLVVAERAAGERLGFVLVLEREDFFRGTAAGYISEIAVTAEAEGSGAAGALMDAALAWSRARGHDRIGLTVFASNQRARRFYERLGYEAEAVIYTRLL